METSSGTLPARRIRFAVENAGTKQTRADSTKVESARGWKLSRDKSISPRHPSKHRSCELRRGEVGTRFRRPEALPSPRASAVASSQSPVEAVAWGLEAPID